MDVIRLITDGVELSFDVDEAIKEAKRCLRCELRLQISPPLSPPEEWLRFEARNVSLLPEVEGVYQLLDEQKSIIYIKGTMNLRQELQEQLETNKQARYFKWEEEPMYTRRESELIQQFLQAHGRLPVQNDELVSFSRLNPLYRPPTFWYKLALVVETLPDRGQRLSFRYS